MLLPIDSLPVDRESWASRSFFMEVMASPPWGTMAIEQSFTAFCTSTHWKALY
jgi:hypothetical protein